MYTKSQQLTTDLTFFFNNDPETPATFEEIKFKTVFTILSLFGGFFSILTGLAGLLLHICLEK